MEKKSYYIIDWEELEIIERKFNSAQLHAYKEHNDDIISDNEADAIKELIKFEQNEINDKQLRIQYLKARLFQIT